MTKEQKIFLQIINDYINKKHTILFVKSINWKTIDDFAVKHGVTAIIYYQCKSFMPETEKAMASYASQIYNSVNRKSVVLDMKTACAGMDYIFIKGLAVAELYPVPELRSMGDIDVLIHSKDRKRVHQALTGHNFDFIKSWKDEWNYSKNNFLFEVHDSLIHEAPGKEYICAYYDKVWDYVKDGNLDWNFHFIYLIEHMRCHFVAKGVGLRMFMDIAIVCKVKEIELNWPWIEQELEKVGLLQFARTILTLNEKWFDVLSPIETVKLSDDFVEQAVQKVFDDGIFGFSNPENENNDIAWNLYYQKRPYIIIKLKYIFQQAFPVYGEMIRLPYCSYVKKHRALLPLAWIHRFFYRIKNKDHRQQMKKRVFASKNEVDSRSKLLKEWGL